MFLGSYPITPASDILHELSKHKNFGVRTLQAEDEIAAITSAIGAAFGGHLGVTTTSGPGLALKAEAMGLAVSPSCRWSSSTCSGAVPSTGLPTKTEQADLLHGPVRPVVGVTAADRGPQEPGRLLRGRHRGRPASRSKYRTPVLLLSDGYLANGAEPWLLPDVADLPDISVPFTTEANAHRRRRQPGVPPYLRNDDMARPGPCRAQPGLEHRIGGLEKQDGTGNVSYDPANHEHMVHLRAERIEHIADDIPLARGRRPATTPSCWSSGGARPGAPSTAPSTASGTGATRWP